MSDWEIVDDNEPEWAIMDDSYQSQQEPEMGGMEKFYRASGIHGANKAFANIFGFGEHVQNANQAANRAKETHPFATGAGELAADIYSSIPFLLAGNLAGKAIPGIGKTGQSIAGAIAGGGAYGGIQQPQEGESRLGNAAKDAALWGAFPVAGAALGVGKNLIGSTAEALTPTRYSQGKTVTEAKNMYQDFSKYFKDNYKNVLSNPNLPPQVKATISPRALSKYKKAAPKLSANVEKAAQGGSLEDIHKAATDVGKFIRQEQKKVLPNDEALKFAESIKNRLESKIDRTLSKVPGLKDSYRALDKEYESTIGRMDPDLIRSFKDFGKNRIGSKDVMRRMNAPKKGELFRHRFQEELPGIELAKKTEGWKNVPIMREGVNLFRKYLGEAAK